MITIFHGNNIESSRTAFIQEKKKHPDTIVFDGKSIAITELVQAIEGGGLFSEQKTIAIEDLFTKKPSIELDVIITFLKKSSLHIILWEGKELTKKQLSIFPKAKVNTHSYPKVLFQFLDSIAPQNRNSLKLFHELLASTAAELIFFMMVRQIRVLLAFSSKEAANIEEVTRLEPWQRAKLHRQASMFSQNALIHMHKQLFEIDVATKSGGSPLLLPQAIDFFLVGL